MIIYNTREVSPKYQESDNVIVEIRSPLSLSDILEKLRAGEKLSADTLILAYAVDGNPIMKPMDVVTADTREKAKEFCCYSKWVNSFMSLEDQEEYCEEYEQVHFKRDKLFKAYESYCFNRPWPDFIFDRVNLTKQELMQQLFYALHIMPSLWEADDKTVDELKRMSASGERLYWRFDDKAVAREHNKLPCREDIEFYESLNDYEKRIINASEWHPLILVTAARIIKQKTSGTLFTKAHTNRTSPPFWEKAPDAEEAELLIQSTAIFQSIFHGHVPKVIREYMIGQLLALGKSLYNMESFFRLTTDELRAIAVSFQQKSVAKVAKYRNPVLLALSDKINFATVPEDHITALGVFLTPQRLKDCFLDKGFAAWYQAHQNVNVSELIELLGLLQSRSAMPNFTFAMDKSAKELILSILHAKGIRDCKRMEEKYHYHFADNELAIRGRGISVQDRNLKMYMLSKDDYRNFTVGYDTHCCQRYGDAGETCVFRLTSDPFAGCVVIEKNGHILAQGFVWTDEERDTLVFDNVEFASDRQISQFSNLFAAYAEAMPYKNIHVGVGFNQGMNAWGKKVTFTAHMPTTIPSSDGYCYSDYHSDARALKKDGNVLLPRNNNVKTYQKVDEPSRWDVLISSGLSFLLNQFELSPEDKISFAKEFLDNSSPEIQLKAVKISPKAILHIDDPTEEVQRYVLSAAPELAKGIKHPSMEVQLELVRQDESYIRHIENPSEETALSAVSRNGLLLKEINHPTDAVKLAAVRQNAYAIRMIPSREYTEELLIAAVTSMPKVVSMLISPSESVLSAAVCADPHVIGLLSDPPGWLQRKAVEADPSVISDIAKPEYATIRAAVERNGLLIRMFPKYPELRKIAIAQNPFAVNVLRFPTQEEYLLAAQTNPAIINTIQDPIMRQSVSNTIQSSLTLSDRDCSAPSEDDYTIEYA